MGSPKNEISRFSIKWQTELLSTAKQSALHFRSREYHEQALEHLRKSLLPLVDWLDKPTKECFRGYDEIAFRNGPKRAMSVFEWRSEGLTAVALDRRGRWITMEKVPTSGENSHMLEEISSVALATKIEENRFRISNIGLKQLEAADSIGLGQVISHCAFINYTREGVALVGKTIREREERLQVIRANHDILMSFTAGLDPLAFEPMQLPGFSVWNKYDRGSSRCSGVYFDRELAATEVIQRNVQHGADSKTKYYVFDDSILTSELQWFLSRICMSIGEIKEALSSSARKPMSDEERAIIKGLADSIGSSY